MGDDLSTDHDLLIMLSQQMNDIKRTLDIIAPTIRSLDQRIGDIEESSGRHSERLAGLRSDVNSLKLDKLNRQELESLKEDVATLKTKSNVWDFFNSFGIAILAILDMIFRK